MALHGVGKSTYSLKIASRVNNKIYDVIAKGAITIQRDINTASQLTATIRRNSTTQGEPFTPEWGDEVSFTLDEDHNQFKGYIRQTQKYGEWCDIIAYDQIWFMANHKLDYTYQDKKLNEVLLDLCDTYGIPVLDPVEFEDTQYVIPFRSETNVTLLDVITKGCEITKENTGIMYYLWDDFGNIRINSSEWLAAENWTIVAPGFFESYKITESRDNFRSQMQVRKKEKVKVETEETDADGNTKTKNKTETQQSLYTADNTELEDKYGVVNDIVDLPEGIEDAQGYAETLLKEYEKEPLKLSITKQQGDITVRGGTPLFVDFFSNDRMENIRGWFLVESVTHTIERAHHTMDLTLTELQMFSDWDDPYQAITGKDGLVTDYSDAEYYGGLKK